MRDHLNEKEDVVDSIRLQLRHPSGTHKVWIIVEGETDYKLFSKLILGDQVEFETSHGGLNALLNAVSELLKETHRVLGIRDADFLHLEGKTEIVENVFLTDFHDAEMMMIACNEAYRSVSSEYLSKEKEDLFILREKLLKSIAFIGGLRWINDNHSNSLELNFRDLDFKKFYDGGNLHLNEETFLREMMNRSKNRKKDISKDEISAKIQNTSDFLNLCNGHDFLRGLASCVKSRSKKKVKDKELGQAFRVAYRFEDFKQTHLYQQLKIWSDRQAKKLFKDENENPNRTNQNKKS